MRSAISGEEADTCSYGYESKFAGRTSEQHHGKKPTGRYRRVRQLKMGQNKRICIGLTAHVDAGKTTLAEAMMFEAGKVKKIGRVDHKNSTLDYETFERARGITAFSKQAVFTYGNTDFTLIDTPGHAALFEETKRGLKIPDAAILVINGAEGVQADTVTIWSLLEEEKIPVWIFVTKMDLSAWGHEEILKELREKLSAAVIDFGGEEWSLYEELASCDERCMEEFLSNETIEIKTITEAIENRNVFPCFFGSGLKLEGVGAFLTALDKWLPRTHWPEMFSAFCYKVSRDARGQRMTQMKITGGSLSVRKSLRYRGSDGTVHDEKVTEIRIYSGARFEKTETVQAGQVCSVIGLSMTEAGQTLGESSAGSRRKADSVQRFLVQDPDQKDPVVLLSRLRQLGEEWPELDPAPGHGGISVCLNGTIQAEMLKELMRERFGSRIELSEGRLTYRETVNGRVEGIGHFEPLRHYAEVHLLIEGLPEGSGLRIESACPEDVLERSWQNVILETLRSSRLPGILTGSELTDMRICLVSGRAHPKHTEGGDFREAAFRALRQGLMKAENHLLEPVLNFVLSLPPEEMGRAISDLKMMHAEFSTPEQGKNRVILKGKVPASEFGGYPETLLSYTHGEGRVTFHPAGYQMCHNEADVLKEIEYDPKRDTEWPADSVFCAHGGGYTVAWEDVESYMHLPSVLEQEERRNREAVPAAHVIRKIDDRELEAIMLREFGPVKRPQTIKSENRAPEAKEQKPSNHEKSTLLIDGYNLIFAEPGLKQIAAGSLDAARTRLLDRISNYCGLTGKDAIVVFDGYRAAGNPGTKTEYANIRVIFTQEGESADAYIERIADEIGKNETVSVVTGDTMIRISAMRSGILRIMPGEFIYELQNAERQLETILSQSNLLAHQTPTGDALAGDYRNEKENNRL